MRGWGGIIVVRSGQREQAGLAGVDAPCLVPLANRSILQHALDQLVRARVQPIVIVCETALASAIQSQLGRFSRARVLEVEDATDELAGIALARELLGTPQVAVHAADVLVGEDIGRYLTLLEGQEAQHALEICPGVLLLRAAAADDARNLEIRRLDELVSALVATGTPVAPIPSARGWWQFDASRGRLLEGNRLALERMQPSVPNQAVVDSVVHGRLAVHPSAVVRRSVIRGPVVIGAGAQVLDAYIGPYSSIGSRAIVENAEVEHSLLMHHAAISHAGVRIEGTVLGPGSRVTRTFGIPKAMHMHLGPGAQVVLS